MPAMLDREDFALEARHALMSPAVNTLSRHRDLSLNWITSAASCGVILI
jgi:hypothetical protein